VTLYEFDCPTCGRVEKRCPVATLETTCPQCGVLIPRAYSFNISIHYIPSYFEACEETDRMMKERKIAS